MAERSERKRRDRSLDDVYREYEEHNERLGELPSALQENLEESLRIDDAEYWRQGGDRAERRAKRLEKSEG